MTNGRPEPDDHDRKRGYHVSYRDRVRYEDNSRRPNIREHKEPDRRRSRSRSLRGTSSSHHREEHSQRDTKRRSPDRSRRTDREASQRPRSPVRQSAGPSTTGDRPRRTTERRRDEYSQQHDNSRSGGSWRPDLDTTRSNMFLVSTGSSKVTGSRRPMCGGSLKPMTAAELSEQSRRARQNGGAGAGGRSVDQETSIRSRQSTKQGVRVTTDQQKSSDGPIASTSSPGRHRGQHHVNAAAGPSGYNQNLGSRGCQTVEVRTVRQRPAKEKHQQHVDELLAREMQAALNGTAEDAPESKILRRDSRLALSLRRDDDLRRALEASQDRGALQRSSDDNLQRATRESRTTLPAALSSADDNFQRAMVASQNRKPADPSETVGRPVTPSSLDDDLQRAIWESRNTIRTNAPTRSDSIATPLSSNEDLQQAIRASLAAVSASEGGNDDLQRAIVASRASSMMLPWHMPPGTKGLYQDVIRLTSNAHPTAPADWIGDHDDLPRITIRFRMDWRVTIRINVVARSRRSFYVEAVVEVELRTEDLGEHLRARPED